MAEIPTNSPNSAEPQGALAPANERASTGAAGRVDAFAERCRQAGFAATAQRLLIYRCLATSYDHPTAEVLWSRVRNENSRVSLATVYRNLRAFADAGFIEEVATGASISRWDANEDDHHHLVCEGCGAVRDCYAGDLESLDLLAPEALASQEILGFSIRSARINLFGRCEACLREDDRSAGEPPDS
jgi:Fur family peroxide stress response transcriptional regulator